MGTRQQYGAVRVLAVLVSAAVLTAGQKKMATAAVAAPQAQTASFGTLVPGPTGGPVTVTMPYTLSIPAVFAAKGFRVNATGSCSFLPSAPAAGGKTISESDIGIGIVTTSTAPGLSIAPGMNYDPGAVKGANGKPMYAGASSGKATMADLRAGFDILRGDKAPAGNQLNVSLRVATVPQFTTPGSLSCQIILAVM